MSAETVARRAAAELGAEMDPSLPARIEGVLSRSSGTRPDRLCSADALASFLVASAHIGYEMMAAWPADAASAPRFEIADHLARAMGVDPGMSADHERIVEAVAAAIAAFMAEEGSG